MNTEKKLNTIDGATLMSQPLKPLCFVVDTLLSQGLHILAGSWSCGKRCLQDVGKLPFAFPCAVNGVFHDGIGSYAHFHNAKVFSLSFSWHRSGT